MHISDELAQRISAGDEHAYEQFFQEQWKHAVYTCWLILRHQHDAEEAAQDAFLKLYVYRRELRDPAKFRSWFYRILANASMDKARRRRPSTNLDNVLVPDTDNGIGQAEQRMLIAQAMSALSAAERLALVLVHFNDLTEAEAANAAGWSLGKLKYRVNRARRTMAKVIGAGEDDRVHGWNVSRKEGLKHV